MTLYNILFAVIIVINVTILGVVGLGIYIRKGKLIDASFRLTMFNLALSVIECIVAIQ